jgi:uncharacterized protein (DUF2236 family)
MSENKLNQPYELPEALDVSSEAFEEQLAKVAALVEDPNAGLFGPDSMVWHVFKHTMAGYHAAGRSLLLQIMHPWVTTGIDEHSKTREDIKGRSQRTFTAVYSILFGSLDQAMKEARRVNRVHSRITGVMTKDKGAFKEGTPYKANEAHAMLWVHATIWENLIRTYELLIGDLTQAQKEQYYQESKLFAYMFGIPEEIIPKDWNSFLAYNESILHSDILHCNEEIFALYDHLWAPTKRKMDVKHRWFILTTAATMPEHLRAPFNLVYGEKEQKAFKKGVRIIRFIEPLLPTIIKRGSTYIEANNRIKGKKSGWLVKKVNKRVFGREELVA